MLLAIDKCLKTNWNEYKSKSSDEEQDVVEEESDDDEDEDDYWWEIFVYNKLG